VVPFFPVYAPLGFMALPWTNAPAYVTEELMMMKRALLLLPKVLKILVSLSFEIGEKEIFWC
jgi:hypothetical protein